MTRRVLIMFTVLLVIAAVLGFYAYHFKVRVVQEEQRLAQQPQVLVPPASGPTTPVILFIASDSDAALQRTQTSLPLPEERSERLRAVLRALFTSYLQPSSGHPIGAGSDVQDVFLIGTDTAVVDTNAAFADSHPSGVLAEQLTISSIVATLNSSAPQIRRVKILVNGKERETLAGHADLRRFYTTSELELPATESK
jgi:hypothetical protein